MEKDILLSHVHPQAISIFRTGESFDPGSRVTGPHTWGILQNPSNTQIQ